MGKILKKTIKEKWGKSLYVENLFLVFDKINNEVVRPISLTGSPFMGLMFGYYRNTAWYQIGGHPKIHFSKYFDDWQNPTKNEIILFELETGLMYIDYYLGLRTWSYEE